MTFYNEKHDDLLMGDFNIITFENHHLKDFTDSNDLKIC